MFSLKIFLLGVALAIDAAVVTFAIGLLHTKLNALTKIQRGLIISLLFGAFQGLMILGGAKLGYLVSFSGFGYYSQIGVGFIFYALAFKFFYESSSQEEKEIKWSLLPLLLLAFATSIDAFAAGIGLGTLPDSYLISMEVGGITFLICALFYMLGQVFRNIPEKWLLRFSGIIFLFLGTQTLWSYRNILF